MSLTCPVEQRSTEPGRLGGLEWKQISAPTRKAIKSIDSNNHIGWNHVLPPQVTTAGSRTEGSQKFEGEIFHWALASCWLQALGRDVEMMRESASWSCMLGGAKGHMPLVHKEAQGGIPIPSGPKWGVRQTGSPKLLGGWEAAL